MTCVQKVIGSVSRCVFIAGMLIASAWTAHAQSKLSDQSESPAKIAQFAKPETSAQSSVDAFIAKLNNVTRTIYANSKNDPASIRDGCRNLLNEILELNVMAQNASADTWNQMTLPQRENFRLAFEQRMIGKCVQQFGEDPGEGLELVGVRKSDGGNLFATIRAGSQDANKLWTWRLQSSGPDSLRAIDIIIEGRSIIENFKSEFAAVLRGSNGDIEALLRYMRK